MNGRALVSNGAGQSPFLFIDFPEAEFSREGAKNLGMGDLRGGEKQVAAFLALYPDLIPLARANDEQAARGHGGADREYRPRSGTITASPTGNSGDASGAAASQGAP